MKPNPKLKTVNQTRIDKFLVTAPSKQTNQTPTQTPPFRNQENKPDPTLELGTKQETNKSNQTQLHIKPEQQKQETPQEKNSEKPNQTSKNETLMDKKRKFSSKLPPKLPTNNQTRRITTNNKENPPKPNNTGAGTKQEHKKTTRDTKTPMEIIKQKQIEGKQQNNKQT